VIRICLAQTGGHDMGELRDGLRAWLPLLMAPVVLGGCATIFTGTRDTLTFDSNVPGVRLTLDGQYRGELPLTLDMSRNFTGGQQFVAKFEKEGYATQEFRLNRDFNAVAILDVTSPITSGGIDVLTGSLLKFSPRDYHVQMLPAGGSAQSAEFRRSVDLQGFALTNYLVIQKDIARGGGENLATLAALTAGDETGARLITEASLRSAPALLGASSAHAFVERFNRMLAGSPSLAGYQL